MNDEFETPTGGTPEIPQAAPIPEPTPIPDPVPMAASADPTPAESVEPQPVESEPAEPQPAVDAPVTQPPVQPDPQYPNPFAPPAQPTAPVYNPAQPAQSTPPVYNPAQPAQPTPPVYNPAQPAQPTPPVYNPAQPTPPVYNPAQPTPPVYNPTQPTYTPPQYTPQYGAYPPQPPVPPYTPGAYARPNPVPPKKSDGKVGRILMWIAAALIEAVIVGFAIYGVYALCRGDAAPAEPNRPSYSQGDNRPGAQNPNDDTSSGSTAQNNSKVQMGITCFELPDQYVQAYGIDKGLVVKSFSADSPAKDTELQVGDVITQFNGVRVTSFQSLFDEMEKLDVGDEVTLTCYRMNASGESYQASEPFEVTFRVQARQDAVSSTYPGA